MIVYVPSSLPVEIVTLSPVTTVPEDLLLLFLSFITILTISLNFFKLFITVVTPLPKVKLDKYPELTL